MIKIITRILIAKRFTWAASLATSLISIVSFSAQFNVNDSRNGGENRQLSRKTVRAQHSSLATRNLKNESGGSMDAAFDYQRDFKNSKNRSLFLSYRFMRNRDKVFNDLDSLADDTNFDIYLQRNLGILSEHSFQSDYTQPLGKALFETGLKSISRSNRSSFNSSVDDEKTLSANNFANRQSIWSFYSSMQYKYKKWGVKVGFRLEQTFINAEFQGVESELSRSYLSFIPSVIFGKKLGTLSSLSFSYTTRVQRPGIAQLNPFVDRSNPEHLTSGNPDLGRGYTHVFKMGYNFNGKLNLNVSLGSLLLRNMIGRISTYDEQNNITHTSFRNTSSANVFKTNIYLNYPVSKQIRVTLNTDLRYVTGEFIKGRETIRNEGFLQYLNLSTNYSFSSGFQFNAGFTFNSKGFSSVQNRTNGYAASSFGITKDFLKKKLSFSARVSNPFTKFRLERDEIDETGFWQLNNQQTYYRSFSTSINYRFGRLKESVKKSKRRIVNDDLD